jgi:hypothetical protein
MNNRDTDMAVDYHAVLAMLKSKTSFEIKQNLGLLSPVQITHKLEPLTSASVCLPTYLSPVYPHVYPSYSVLCILHRPRQTHTDPWHSNPLFSCKTKQAQIFSRSDVPV